MKTASAVLGFVPYSDPAPYEAVVVPRFSKVSEDLLDFAPPGRARAVLELGAGTGCLTRVLLNRLNPGSVATATDRSAAMLGMAGRVIRTHSLRLVRLNHHEPLPFLDDTFDAAYAQLTTIQDSTKSIAEVLRVLRPAGVFSLAMWDSEYDEVALLSRAREHLGQPPIRRAQPGRVVERLIGSGFSEVHIRPVDYRQEFKSASAYVDYREALGLPKGAADRQLNSRILRAAHDVLTKRTLDHEPTVLGWRVVLITARAPRCETNSSGASS